MALQAFTEFNRYYLYQYVKACRANFCPNIDNNGLTGDSSLCTHTAEQHAGHASEAEHNMTPKPQ